jgi:hypothetical protein
MTKTVSSWWKSPSPTAAPATWATASLPASGRTTSLRVSTPLKVSVKERKSPPLATRAKTWVAARRSWSRPWVRTWWKTAPFATSTSVTLLKRAAAGPLSSSVRRAGLDLHDVVEHRVGRSPSCR